MDKEKFYNYFIYFILIALFIFNVVGLFKDKVPNIVYKEEGWDYGWTCTQYAFERQVDAENGWNCRLDACEIISQNPRIEECICAINNLTINRVCVNEQYTRNYPYPTFRKSQPINIVINISGGNESEI